MKKLLLPALLSATCMAVYAEDDLVPYFMLDFNTEETAKKATIGNDVEFINVVDETVYDPIQFFADGEGVTQDDGYVLVPMGAYIKADFSEHPCFVSPADPENPYMGTYTVVLDVKLPRLGTYYCLFNSNPWNTTDSKLCINTKGLLGSGFLGGYQDTWQAIPENWYRITLTASQPDGKYGLYSDGELVDGGTSGNISKIDGRYALEQEGTLFLADNDEEDADIYCTKIMFYDRALTADEVKALGSPETPVAAGVENIAADEAVTLNVTNGVVNVKVIDGNAATVTVYNIGGSTVAEATVTDVYSWNSADAVAGAYVVKVASAAGVKTAKLIVR